jgi:hypothetical protein
MGMCIEDEPLLTLLSVLDAIVLDEKNHDWPVAALIPAPGHRPFMNRPYLQMQHAFCVAKWKH